MITVLKNRLKSWYKSNQSSQWRLVVDGREQICGTYDEVVAYGLKRMFLQRTKKRSYTPQSLVLRDNVKLERV